MLGNVRVVRPALVA